MENFIVSMVRLDTKGALSNAELKNFDSLITKFSPTIDNDKFKEFVYLVGKRGWIFCPSIFNGHRKSKETYKQSQLVALYFNSASIPGKKSASYYEIKDRAKRYELPILFAYDCYSLDFSDEIERFCIVFLLNNAFSELREAEAVQKALMMIFPEANKNYSVLSLYQGGNEVLYWDKTMPVLDVDWLFMKMCLCLKERYGSTNYKRKVIKFSKETGLVLDEKGLPEITIVDHDNSSSNDNENDKIMPKCIIDINRSGKILSNVKYKIHLNDANDHSDNEQLTWMNSSKRSPYRSNDLKQLDSGCRLYHEFMSGERNLSQCELHGLATNLAQVESGAAMFKRTLRSKSYYLQEQGYDDWNYHFFYLKGRDVKPCKSFCPYHGNCPHGKNILSTLRPRYHQIEKVADYDECLVGLDEASEDFKEKFIEAVESDEKGWHVIKSQTALGKTETVLSFLRDFSCNVLIAVPTNILKREVCERAKKMGVDIIASPSLHELEDDLPEDVWDDIESLYNAGKSPMSRVNKAIADDEGGCAKLLQRYKKELSLFSSSSNSITTHRRLAKINVSKYDFVIVDEDIIYSTIVPSRETVSRSELKRLRKKLVPTDILAVKIKEILKQSKQSEFFTLEEIDYDESYADIKMEINIPALCSAQFFCHRTDTDLEGELDEDCITFVNPVQFPEGQKYIMLSATADKNICEYCFGEGNVRFYECKEAAITGVLNQYGDRPMGRSSMRKRPEIIGKIKKWSRFNHTISFKEFHKYYVGDLHFGNCAGCDTLKNTNIDVIGTPHQPDWIYKLFAYSLGYDVDDQLKPNIVVVHNGFRFRFMTYTDKILRDIQFYMIESELEQAVGRARLLRCNCIVNLFSDYPLKQAIQMESEYDKD